MLSTLVFREFRYTKEIEDVKDELKVNILLNPTDVESLKKLAGIYHAYSQNDIAIQIYEQLSKMTPNDHEIEGYLGYLYYENGDLLEAEERLKNALYLSENEPFLLFLLGNIYSRRGKILDATKCYELAIFLDFDMYAAHIDFAKKYEHMGRHKKALAEYKAAYNIDSRDQTLIDKIDYLKNKIENIVK